MKSLVLSLLVAQGLLPVALRAQDPYDLIVDGHFKHAKALVEAACARSPSNARNSFLLSRVRAAFDDLSGALAASERAVASAPSEPEYHLELSHVLALTAGQPGLFWKRLSFGKRAKEEIDKANVLRPNWVPAMVDLATFYYVAPGVAGGDKQRAASLLEEIARLDPCEGYLAKARRLDRKEKAPEIHALLLQAVQANPRNYDARARLAELDIYIKNYPEAETAAEAATAMKPGRVLAFRYLASLHAAAGNLAQLDSVLERSRRAVPDDLSPLYEAARELIDRRNDFPRAQAYLRTYLSQEPEGQAPDKASTHFQLARALAATNSRPEAIGELREAIRFKPDREAYRKELKRLSTPDAK